MFGIIFLIICCLGVLLFITCQVENHKIIGEVTNTNRGEYSERDLILKLRRNGVESSRLLHDLYIPTKGNNFSQIDLIFLSGSPYINAQLEITSLHLIFLNATEPIYGVL